MIELIFGHFFSALLFYLNHRFIFHTKLGNLKFIKKWKKVHILHHKHDYDSNWKKYALIPVMGWVAFSIITVLIALVTTFYFAIGMLSYVILYEIIHYRIHSLPQKNNTSQFHYDHHRKSPKHNFATFWVFIDKAFGTYQK